MSPGKIPYRFKSRPWKYDGPAGWYFVSLPKDMADEIREHFKEMEEGWGRLPATAAIEGLEWKTAIWYDTKQKTYLLPLKAEVRKKLKLDVEMEQEVIVYL